MPASRLRIPAFSASSRFYTPLRVALSYIFEKRFLTRFTLARVRTTSLK